MKKRHIKRHIPMLLVLCMLFTACGTQESDPASQPQPPAVSQPEASSQPDIKVEPIDLNFGAGAMGGNYYIIAGAMKSVAEKYCPSIKSMSVLAGASSQFMAECQEGSIDLYMNTIDALYFGYAGTGQQGFPEGTQFDKSLFVTIMYNHMMGYYTLANSPINNMSEVTGRVAVPSPTMVGFTIDLLRACGVVNPQVDAVNDYNQMNQGLKDGTYQLVLHGGPVPHSSTVELAASTEIKVVNMTTEQIAKCIAEGPDSGMCQEFVIPAGSYDFMTEDYTTFGRAATVSCNADLPEQVVYEFTKAIYECNEEICAVYAPMAEMTLEAIQAAADAGVIKVPVHPGARRYYEEQGIVFPDSVPR